jgi:hypothetical protein
MADDRDERESKAETKRRFLASGMLEATAALLAERFTPEPPEPADERDPAAPFNATVYEALRAQGIPEELARELAEECGPDTEIEVGPTAGERTLVWPGVPTKKPREP